MKDMQNELINAQEEIFDLKKRIMELEAENLKLKTENTNLKTFQGDSVRPALIPMNLDRPIKNQREDD